MRPSVVFGHGDSFLNMFASLLRKAPLLPLAGADTRFAPIWAGDVAHAVAACLSRRAAIGQSLAGPAFTRWPNWCAWWAATSASRAR